MPSHSPLIWTAPASIHVHEILLRAVGRGSLISLLAPPAHNRRHRRGVAEKCAQPRTIPIIRRTAADVEVRPRPILGTGVPAPSGLGRATSLHAHAHNPHDGVPQPPINLSTLDF